MNPRFDIPEPTVKRLSNYLHYLLQIKHKGMRYISSTQIADELLIESGKVRKDFQYARIKGRPKRGYEIDYLINAIDKILKWSGPKSAILIGVGSLGTALLGYENFINYGLKFVAAVDNDTRKVGLDINGVKIADIKNMKQIIESSGAVIAVITVPDMEAQAVVDVALSAGIKGLWNFAPIRLRVPSEIINVNAQFTQTLAVLTQRLR